MQEEEPEVKNGEDEEKGEEEGRRLSGRKRKGSELLLKGGKRRRKTGDDCKSDESSKTKNHHQNNNDDLKPPKKGERVEDLPSYYIYANGLRYIAPYPFYYRCYVKGRWIDKPLIKVLCKEFLAFDEDYYRKAIEDGRITIRGDQVHPDYIIKDGDWLAHFLHRHEPPVKEPPYSVIHSDDDCIVIDKSSSIAVHAAGKYRHNSIVFSLKHQFKVDVFSVHRLDRVTSGLLILAKNTRFSSKMGKLLMDKQQSKVKKWYLAKVEGMFDLRKLSLKSDLKYAQCEMIDGLEYCRVTAPMSVESHREGKHQVNEHGKSAETLFRVISVDLDQKSSLMECQPKTGRTHQIRVHLQYLGFPIVNDFAYGFQGDALDQRSAHDNHLIDNPVLWEECLKHYQPDCLECRLWKSELTQFREQCNHDSPSSSLSLCCSSNDPSFEPAHKAAKMRDSIRQIYLHALKYQGPGFCYQTRLPSWAHSSAEESTHILTNSQGLID